MEEDSKKLMNLTPTDLRVGNYVNYENTTHVIDEIHKNKVIHHWLNSKQKKFDVYSCAYNEIESIPLCQKEIEKLGFLRDENGLNPDLYIDEYGDIIKEIDGDFCLCKFSDDEVVKISQIDFVHQLQNLYFLLYKRELVY